MASKYDALAGYLRRQSGPRITNSFAEIEALIGTQPPMMLSLTHASATSSARALRVG